jgi:uridylate kinase
MLHRHREERKIPEITGKKIEKFEKVVLEEPEKKEPAKKLEPISDNELSVSMKKLADMMAESSARQQEILEFLKGKESKSEEQPKVD